MTSATKPFSKGWILVLCAWSVIICTGFLSLSREEFGAAPESTTRSAFPANSAVALSDDKPTLLLFVHPYCPCTISSLDELDQVVSETKPENLSVTVIFTIAPGLPLGWKQNGHLWSLANHLPGVHILCDQDGVEAKRFHIIASGHALLYNTSGQLLFSGGITPSRGHEGDNAGTEALVNLVLGRTSAVDRTPVFGCPLL
jgi:hypothetical protein